MIEMQRWARSYGYAYQGMTGDRSDMIWDSEGEWVKFADAEAAIADMLAKCIAVVEHHFGPKDYELRWLLDGEAVLNALRALQGK
jgi:hypothetical protein